MKIPFFGRKSPPPREPPSTSTDGNRDALPGHSHVLDHLRKIEAQEPLARPRLVGGLLCDMVRQMIVNEHSGARIEDLLAILASNGGFSCLVAAVSETVGRSPTPASNLTVLGGKDGYRYFFGDLPNRYLLESEFSLLGLALSAARACGGTVSVEMAHQTIRHVANTVGGEAFGLPQLPDDHRPGDLPFNYVKFLWPKFRDGLMLDETPPTQWPVAIGFALQRAIEAGKDVIDPTLAARIAIECAVPMAKIDPERIA